MADSALVGPGQPIQNIPPCFNRLQKELPSWQPVTLYTTNRSVVRGINPVISNYSSTLYLTMLSDSVLTTGRIIPFKEIDSLTFRRPSRTNGVSTGIGLVLGAAAGAAIAASTGDREAGFPFDFSSEIGRGILGGVLGSILGAVIGSELGKHPATTVTLNCR